MERTILHHEIKALKANLMRNSFTKFTNSEEFRLIKIEYDYDDYIKPFKRPAGGLDPEWELDAVMDFMNDLLNSWMHPAHGSSEVISIETYFNNFLFNILNGFIEWVSEIKQPEKLALSLKNLGPIKQNNYDRIKNLIDQKNIQVDSQSFDNKPTKNSIMNFEYAVITALEEEEMEKVLPLIEKVGEISDTRNYIEYGHLKTDVNKNIVYASQHNPGMVDAAILASELITRFKPKYLIMTGVLGGKPEETKIGDVVIATKVIEIGKGKISDLGFKSEASIAATISKEIKKIHRAKKDIENFIVSSDSTRSKPVTLHFGPIACVNQVIDVEGFFEENISSIDRKAIALEMESYSIARTCEILNDGRTIPIIIKSVMDNTQAKTDDAKSYASWTSAKVFEYIITKNII